MKIETIYRDILKKAWEITFKNKTFWFLGLFAAPLLIGGSYKILAHSLGIFSPTDPLLKWADFSSIFSMEVMRYLVGQIFVSPFTLFMLLFIFVLFVLFTIFLIWISIVSQGALISAVNKKGDQKISPIGVSQFIGDGITNFWRLAGINFFIELISFLSLILISVSFLVFMFSEDIYKAKLTLFYHLIFVLVFIALNFFMGFIGKYAINYIIIEKDSFGDAIVKGYKLFVKNWIASLEMCVIIFFITVLMIVSMSVVSFFIAIPAIFAVIILSEIGILILTKFVLFLVILFFVIVTFFFTAVLSTFQYCSWVLFFKELQKETKPMSKLMRWANIQKQV